MAHKTLQEVALASLQTLRDRKRFRQVHLAERLKTKPAAVSETLSGKRPVTLRFMEAVSELTGIHPGEFLLDPHRDEMKVVSGIEMQMLRYFRSWPAPTREAFLMFVSFFADESPATYEQRVAHEQLRRLKSEAVRRRAYAYLTFLSEGGLTPDLQEAFGLLDSGEPQSTRTEKVTQRTPSKRP
jgi:transcriptional regulator with XRE-family HTH domain